jgi:hypothetical protein
MRINPPAPKSPAEGGNTTSANTPHEKYIGLKGALKSFETTPLAPLIETALAEASIAPYAYDLSEAGHFNYCGLPATEAQATGEEEMVESPIVSAIANGIDAGEIVLRPVALNTVRFATTAETPNSNAARLSKLFPIALTSLHDAASDELLAYAVPLSPDGGRTGHAFVSTQDVVPRA